MTRPDYDVVVIGAGINGAGVAQAAAAAGFSVLLLDKTCPGSGTSSRSSKLIHGGLRYLENLEFGLVHESLRERKLLLKLAPGLVQMKDFYLPIYRGGRRGPGLLRFGLSLYCLLAAGGRGARFGSIPKRDWGRLDGLRQRGLKAVFHYHDAQTDDQGLTLAVVKSAAMLGAVVEYPARVVGLDLLADTCRVDYVSGGGDRSVRAAVVINAAGPWANEVLALAQPPVEPMPIELIRGSHIILAGCQLRRFYYLESPRDGRAVFAMPWQGSVLVGTTESKFSGSPDKVEPSRQEIRYLYSIARYYFPAWNDRAVTPTDSAFAGLRVLPSGAGHAFHRSREIIIHRGRGSASQPPRLFTVYGGKLTVWRSTAEKVMRCIAAVMPRRKPVANTRDISLS